MRPLQFPEVNIVFGENQPEYLPLPAYKNPEGRVITCWSLSWGELLQLLFTGRIWIHVLTFNKAIQPILPSTEYPFEHSPKRLDT